MIIQLALAHLAIKAEISPSCYYYYTFFLRCYKIAHLVYKRATGNVESSPTLPSPVKMPGLISLCLYFTRANMNACVRVWMQVSKCMSVFCAWVSGCVYVRGHPSAEETVSTLEPLLTLTLGISPCPPEPLLSEPSQQLLGHRARGSSHVWVTPPPPPPRPSQAAAPQPS